MFKFGFFNDIFGSPLKGKPNTLNKNSPQRRAGDGPSNTVIWTAIEADGDLMNLSSQGCIDAIIDDIHRTFAMNHVQSTAPVYLEVVQPGVLSLRLESPSAVQSAVDNLRVVSTLVRLPTRRDLVAIRMTFSRPRVVQEPPTAATLVILWDYYNVPLPSDFSNAGLLSVYIERIVREVFPSVVVSNTKRIVPYRANLIGQHQMSDHHNRQLQQAGWTLQMFHKSGADDRMLQDAITTELESTINPLFVVITSDSDFLPVLEQIYRRNRKYLLFYERRKISDAFLVNIQAHTPGRQFIRELKWDEVAQPELTIHVATQDNTHCERTRPACVIYFRSHGFSRADLRHILIKCDPKNATITLTCKPNGTRQHLDQEIQKLKAILSELDHNELPGKLRVGEGKSFAAIFGDKLGTTHLQVALQTPGAQIPVNNTVVYSDLQIEPSIDHTGAPIWTSSAIMMFSQSEIIRPLNELFDVGIYVNSVNERVEIVGPSTTSGGEQGMMSPQQQALISITGSTTDPPLFTPCTAVWWVTDEEMTGLNELLRDADVQKALRKRGVQVLTLFTGLPVGVVRESASKEPKHIDEGVIVDVSSSGKVFVYTGVEGRQEYDPLTLKLDVPQAYVALQAREGSKLMVRPVLLQGFHMVTDHNILKDYAIEKAVDELRASINSRIVTRDYVVYSTLPKNKRKSQQALHDLAFYKLFKRNKKILHHLTDVFKLRSVVQLSDVSESKSEYESKHESKSESKRPERRTEMRSGSFDYSRQMNAERTALPNLATPDGKIAYRKFIFKYFTTKGAIPTGENNKIRWRVDGHRVYWDEMTNEDFYTFRQTNATKCRWFDHSQVFPLPIEFTEANRAKMSLQFCRNAYRIFIDRQRAIGRTNNVFIQLSSDRNTNEMTVTMTPLYNRVEGFSERVEVVVAALLASLPETANTPPSPMAHNVHGNAHPNANSFVISLTGMMKNVQAACDFLRKQHDHLVVNDIQIPIVREYAEEQATLLECVVNEVFAGQSTEQKDSVFENFLVTTLEEGGKPNSRSYLFASWGGPSESLIQSALDRLRVIEREFMSRPLYRSIPVNPTARKGLQRSLEQYGGLPRFKQDNNIVVMFVPSYLQNTEVSVDSKVGELQWTSKPKATNRSYYTFVPASETMSTALTPEQIKQIVRSAGLSHPVTLVPHKRTEGQFRKLFINNIRSRAEGKRIGEAVRSFVTSLLPQKITRTVDGLVFETNDHDVIRLLSDDGDALDRSEQVLREILAPVTARTEAFKVYIPPGCKYPAAIIHNAVGLLKASETRDAVLRIRESMPGVDITPRQQLGYLCSAEVTDQQHEQLQQLVETESSYLISLLTHQVLDSSARLVLQDVKRIAKEHSVVAWDMQKHPPPAEASKQREKSNLVLCEVQTSNVRNVKGQPVTITAALGDLLIESSSVIMNPANSHLEHLGGLARLIRLAAGGDNFDLACQERLAELPGRSVPEGGAIITPGLNLTGPNGERSHVVHVVGPRWLAGGPEVSSRRLFDAISNGLKLTNNTPGAVSISIPPVSAGIFGGPADIACNVIVQAVLATLYELAQTNSLNLEEVRFVSLQDGTEAAGSPSKSDMFAAALRHFSTPGTTHTWDCSSIEAARLEINYIWEYKGDVRGSRVPSGHLNTPSEPVAPWVVYDLDQAVQVEGAYQKYMEDPASYDCTQEVITGDHMQVRNGYKYMVNFTPEAMYQENFTYGTKRRIRRREVDVAEAKREIPGYVEYSQVQYTIESSKPLASIVSTTDEGADTASETEANDDVLGSDENDRLVLVGLEQNVQRAFQIIEETTEDLWENVTFSIPASAGSSRYSVLKEAALSVINDGTHQAQPRNKDIVCDDSTGLFTLQALRGPAIDVLKTLILAAVMRANIDYDRSLVEPPSYWNDRFIDWDKVVEQEYEEFEVLEGSSEWTDVVSYGRFLQTLPTYAVTRILRIENRNLWKKYSTSRKSIAELRRSNGLANEVMAWHGCKDLDSTIIKQTGVDFRHARDGMWGRGAYFAHNAQYSDAYSSAVPGGTDNDRSFFLCRVALGSSCDMRESPQSVRTKLVTPPAGHDSVTGITKNGANALMSDVFIVYDISQSYPEYQVFYRRA